MNKQFVWKGLLVLALGVSLAACSGGKTRVESDLGMDDAPDWVNEGYQALETDDGRLIHGVGSAPRMMDESLQKSTADDRARAEVARVLSSYMNVVSQDYLATAGTGDMAVNEQAISRQIENVTKLNMSGTEIVGRWRDSKTGAIWSLAELDLSRVKKIVASAEGMNEGFRQYFQQHGETVFDRMAGGK